MKVQYSIQKIPGKGKGMISEEFIPKGKLVWEYDEKNAIVLKNREEFDAYMKSCTEEERIDALNVVFGKDNAGIVLLDESKYLNHSKNPTIIQNKELTLNYAARDIQRGEELTLNYLDLHIVDWLEEALKSYGFDNTMDALNYDG